MRKKDLIFLGIVFVILVLGFVLAAANDIVLIGDDVNYTTIENVVYYHNLSANITGTGADISFNFFSDSTNKLKWNFVEISESNISSWISITNSTTGNLTINATYDNQTGFFEIPIRVSWRNVTNSQTYTTGTTFEFIINATNDAPNFTNINSTYTFSNASGLSEFLNATDEEEHYPLNFSVVFNETNCTHDALSSYNNNENCSLYDFGFSLTHVDNVSALIAFDPTNEHVGVYYANVSVMDAGENYDCPHVYCDNTTYEQNQTYYYSSIVTFVVDGSLSINTSNCDNYLFNESQQGMCNITIRTKEATDSLNISSYAILRNYEDGQDYISNTSWFYANESGSASDFIYNVTINVTPAKTEIGNWTINFTVDDDNGDSKTEQIYIYVDKNDSLDDSPELNSISNVDTSVDFETRINLTVYDNDLLIPDKNDYNETISFYVNLTNQTTGVEESLDDFDVVVDSMPVVSGSTWTNQTTAHITFTPNSSELGNYTANITVQDLLGQNHSQVFNISISDDSFPVWNDTSYAFEIWEDNETYLNLSEYVTYSGSLTFDYDITDGNSFASFNLTSAGIINFTSNDSDIGQHLMNITATGNYLSNTTTFNFTIYNINDSLEIHEFEGENTIPTTITNNSQVNVEEDNATVLRLWIADDDLRIPLAQKSFYNESFNVTSLVLNSTGDSVDLFGDFVLSTSALYWPQPNSGLGASEQNKTFFEASFTPSHSDLGNYTIEINITDANEYSKEFFTFNLTINSVAHNPNMSSFTNKSSAINRNFYYDVNVTDTEDGNDTSGVVNTNFTFSYDFLNGTDFINSNESIFNTTTGIFNITFNSSQEGSHKLNLSVNDSSGLIDSGIFWIFVYGTPNITFPAENYVFNNLIENTTSVLNFTVNHSVGDNLTYAFYVDGISYDGSAFNYSDLILRENVSYYGNATNYSWSFTPNFTDETYGNYKNLSLVVYPASDDLENASDLNTTRNFKLNISHNNSPVSFDDNIDDQSTTYSSDITINLWDHFSDVDYDDAYCDEVVSFSWYGNVSGISGPSNPFTSGTLTFSASSAASGEFYVTSSDGDSNATSNNFTITFTTPPSGDTSSSSSSSSTREVPVSLKILMPDPVSAYQKDRIELPITLYNDGSSTLYDITLSGSVAKDGEIVEGVDISFSDSVFGVLASGQKKNITMTIDINVEEEGTYEITVFADVQNPSYSDWGKMFLTIQEGESVREKILFTEEFIVQNPECLELKELVDEANELLKQGKEIEALEKAEEALTACRNSISQSGTSKIKELVENNLYRYLIIATIVAFVLGIAFYSYKRMKLKRNKKSFLQQDIKNRKYLEFKG